MDINLNSWMAEIPDDTNIININIPGTHDSATRYCQFSLLSRCQRKSIPSQLEIGVRVLDLRVDGENMVHSFAKCKTASDKLLTIHRVCEDIYEFLADNPTETVLVFFKNDGKISGEECLNVLAQDIINRNPDKWYLENRFPTIGEARGSVILANRINSSIGLDFSKMPYQGDRKNIESDRFTVCGNSVTVLQDFCTLSPNKKWTLAVEPVLCEAQTDNEYILNYLSTSGFPFIPKYNADILNRKFLEYDLINGNRYGTVMFDFVSKKLSERIVKTNFK